MLRYVYILACVVTLLLSSSVQRQLLYLCQMDGAFHTSCCCPETSDDESGEALETPNVSCCDVHVSTSPVPVVVNSDLTVAPVLLAALPLAYSWPPVDVPRPQTHRIGLDARGPPPGPVAIYLQHQTLLI